MPMVQVRDGPEFESPHRTAVSPTGSCPRHSSHRGPASPSERARSRRRQARVSSFSPAVPPACHEQRAQAVPSGYPRTTPKQHRPARLHASPGDDPTRSGFGRSGSIGRGLRRPCGARPPDRSLIAEGRSAGGGRDRMGPNPRSSRGCSRDRRRHPGMRVYRTRRRFGIHPLKDLAESRRAPANTPRGQFRSRCVRWSDRNQARGHLFDAYIAQNTCL
jgi:hypothetical protein